MLFEIIRFFIIYVIISWIFTITFGAIVIENNDKWYKFILKIMFMPFIVIGSIVMAIKEEIKGLF